MCFKIKIIILKNSFAVLVQLIEYKMKDCSHSSGFVWNERLMFFMFSSYTKIVRDIYKEKWVTSLTATAGVQLQLTSTAGVHVTSCKPLMSSEDRVTRTEVRATSLKGCCTILLFLDSSTLMDVIRDLSIDRDVGRHDACLKRYFLY